MKVRLTHELHGRLMAASAAHGVAAAEICRRAWRRGARLERELPETFGVVLAQFAQTATRDDSAPLEVSLADDSHLRQFAEQHAGRELAALVAYYLAISPAKPSQPRFVPPETEHYLIEPEDD